VVFSEALISFEMLFEKNLRYPVWEHPRNASAQVHWEDAYGMTHKKGGASPCH